MAKSRLTWLGHGTFRVETPEGRTLLLDAWVQNNPACPDAEKKPNRVDAMLITHGHFDHIADAVEIAMQHKPEVVCIYETGHWLESKKVMNVRAMNKGGSQEVCGVKVTMVHAVHSCGILDGERIVYGGEASGYVLELSDGLRLYHAGDTAVFSDMRLIGELYQPEIALLPIGDLFTMGPREAEKAVDLLGVKRVVPMHWGTFPVLTGKPEELRERVSKRGVEVHALQPGETV